MTDTIDDVPSWQFRAACRGEESALFFAPNYFEQRAEKDAREAKAKAICQACPVLKLCREHALAVHEPYGIWGGLSEAERDAIIKSEKRQLAVTG